MEVPLVNDYYPGGMIQPGRSFSAPSYRYGFNGMEKDDEIKGSGNSYTANFWQYDSRIGRRWNPDPVRKSGLSDYLTFGNNPVLFVDPRGNDWYEGESGVYWDDRQGGYTDNNGVEHKSLGTSITFETVQFMRDDTDIPGDPYPGGTKFETQITLTGTYGENGSVSFSYSLYRYNHSCYGDQGFPDIAEDITKGQQAAKGFKNVPELTYGSWPFEHEGSEGMNYDLPRSNDYIASFKKSSTFSFNQATGVSPLSTWGMKNLMDNTWDEKYDPLVSHGLSFGFGSNGKLSLSITHSFFMNTQTTLVAGDSRTIYYQYQTPSYLLHYRSDLLTDPNNKAESDMITTRYNEWNKSYSKTNKIKRNSIWFYPHKRKMPE